MTEAEPKQFPKVGVGVLIQNSKGEILLGHRIGTSHGNDTWSFPGGHLDWGETIEQCAIREVKEETGLCITQVEIFSVYDEHDFLYLGKHYINIGAKAICTSGEPQNLEPEKCNGWQWFDIEDLPVNLMPPTKASLLRYKAGVLYQPNLPLE